MQPVPPGRGKLTPLGIVGIIAAVVVLFCCGGGALIGAFNGSTDETTSTARSGTEQQVESAAEGEVSQDGTDTAVAPADGGEPDAPAEEAPPPAPAAEPGIGDPVRDGKFEFVVNKIECGKSKVGSGFFTETAQGQYCLVTMLVTNIGDEARTFHDGSQRAFDKDGRRFEADTSAGLAVNQDAESFLTEINPGNQVTAIVAFDVPKGVDLVSLELHDSMFSGGVTVRLN
ncbi:MULTISPECIES: DUF4352 domain-containing protein [unclassified Solwaraspora]|uniref:DUF4352 domain-containing protein n=1 Tax=unclassified Solwaraspora TaxID=2627926 RepID=UPI00259BAD9D|nr:DUF4352 domain-containing protein [Solwaraspora sp. WMMA2056]WJK39090.1 DUF4352 domain-containing protein [Solwaraspora sp. WMMA2056]